jgi:hypothetical protein
MPDFSNVLERGGKTMELVVQSARIVMTRESELVFLISAFGLLLSWALRPDWNMNPMLALMLAG